jgi:hypothetical protein
LPYCHGTWSGSSLRTGLPIDRAAAADNKPRVTHPHNKEHRRAGEIRIGLHLKQLSGRHGLIRPLKWSLAGKKL